MERLKLFKVFIKDLWGEHAGPEGLEAYRRSAEKFEALMPKFDLFLFLFHPYNMDAYLRIVRSRWQVKKTFWRLSKDLWHCYLGYFYKKISQEEYKNAVNDYFSYIESDQNTTMVAHREIFRHLKKT